MVLWASLRLEWRLFFTKWKMNNVAIRYVKGRTLFGAFHYTVLVLMVGFQAHFFWDTRNIYSFYCFIFEEHACASRVNSMLSSPLDDWALNRYCQETKQNCVSQKERVQGNQWHLKLYLFFFFYISDIAQIPICAVEDS